LGLSPGRVGRRQNNDVFLLPKKLTLFCGCDILMEDMKKIFKDKFIRQIKKKTIQQFIINGSA
jgi:hypothetical protein